jgi:hypothetical protein
MMTKQQLTDLIHQTAREAVGPAVKAALAPLTQPQGHVAAFLGAGASGKTGDKTMTTTIDNELGAFPLGRKIRALALGKLEYKTDDPDAAIKAVQSAPGWPVTVAEPTVKWLQHVKTTLSAGNASTAGAIVPPSMDLEWIELLRHNAVIRGIGRTYPMPRGATTKRKQTGAATATYQGELGPMTPSNLTVGLATLSNKKLTALTVVSNDLIRFSGGDADQKVQEDLLAVSALREDRAFILGNPPTDTGSPQGIRFQTAGANVFGSAGVTLANVQADTAKAVRLVEESSVPVDSENGYWLMSPATFWVIYNLTSGTGDMVYARGLEQNPPRLLGFRVIKARVLNVSNSWIGANQGQIYFCHGPSLEIHDALTRTIGVFPGGAYLDSGVVQSGISNDETVITSISEHDFLQAYPTAASVITGYAT